MQTAWEWGVIMILFSRERDLSHHLLRAAAASLFPMAVAVLHCCRNGHGVEKCKTKGQRQRPQDRRGQEHPVISIVIFCASLSPLGGNRLLILLGDEVADLLVRVLARRITISVATRTPLICK